MNKGLIEVFEIVFLILFIKVPTTLLIGKLILNNDYGYAIGIAIITFGVITFTIYKMKVNK